MRKKRQSRSQRHQERAKNSNPAVKEARERVLVAKRNIFREEQIAIEAKKRRDARIKDSEALYPKSAVGKYLCVENLWVINGKLTKVPYTHRGQSKRSLSNPLDNVYGLSPGREYGVNPFGDMDFSHRQQPVVWSTLDKDLPALGAGRTEFLQENCWEMTQIVAQVFYDDVPADTPVEEPKFLVCGRLCSHWSGIKEAIGYLLFFGGRWYGTSSRLSAGAIRLVENEDET